MLDLSYADELTPITERDLFIIRKYQTFHEFCKGYICAFPRNALRTVQ